MTEKSTGEVVSSFPQVVREMLMELDQRLFRSYIDHKSEAVVDSIEQGMRTGMFDWEQCAQEPATVRTYIQDIILSLVTVHCEVRAYMYMYIVYTVRSLCHAI